MNRDPRTRMWSDAIAMLDRAERLHRAFFHPASAHEGWTGWEPPVDIFETEDELWILLALPGVTPDQLQLALDGGSLVVAGERKLPLGCRAATVHRMEIPQGRFWRRIPLPPGRYQLGPRALADGCLQIVLTKTP